MNGANRVGWYFFSIFSILSHWPFARASTCSNTNFRSLIPLHTRSFSVFSSKPIFRYIKRLLYRTYSDVDIWALQRVNKWLWLMALIKIHDFRSYVRRIFTFGFQAKEDCNCWEGNHGTVSGPEETLSACLNSAFLIVAFSLVHICIFAFWMKSTLKLLYSYWWSLEAECFRNCGIFILGERGDSSSI